MQISGIGGFSVTEGFSGSGGFSAGGSCWLFAALSSSSLSSCRSCWGRSLACSARHVAAGYAILGPVVLLTCALDPGRVGLESYEQKGCRTKTEIYVTVPNNIKVTSVVDSDPVPCN